MPRINDRIGPYQLSKKLGKGGFGEVWLAKNVTALVSRNPEVALKIPHDEDIDLAAIKQEAAIWLAASGHDNVLPFIEANVYEDHVVFVSEYAPDGSLHSWLKQHGGRAPSIEAAVEMTRGVLNGLAHLHARNIIHRDLKPDNILLQGTTPRITDFGISRVFNSLSQSSVIAGTPVYMAPEAFDGKRNQQTDVWSVGMMLYQMLVGRLPFTGETYGEVMNAVLSKPPHPLPANVPQWLQQVVAEAIAKKPEARYQTATAMLSALTPSVPPSPVVSPKPKHSRRVWLGTIVIILLFPLIWAGISQMGDDTVRVVPTPTATVPSLTFTPKPTATAAATPKVPVKPSSTPTPTATPKPSHIPAPAFSDPEQWLKKQSATPKPPPKPAPTPLPTPSVVVPPRKRPAPVERVVPRVVVPDKPKPKPRPKKQDPICIIYGNCKKVAVSPRSQ